jgi:hypothetical protein
MTHLHSSHEELLIFQPKAARKESPTKYIISYVGNCDNSMSISKEDYNSQTCQSCKHLNNKNVNTLPSLQVQLKSQQQFHYF